MTNRMADRWHRLPEHSSGVSATTLTRRQLVVAGAALSGAMFWRGSSTFARQATPIASPVDATRDWQSERWVGTWAAGVHRPSPGMGEAFPSQIFDLEGKTVRQIVRGSIGGDRVRIRLANTFGDAPLVVGAAHIALRDGDERIEPSTDRTLTFSGSPSVTIPSGSIVLSDPVALDVPPLAELAVSLYFPEPATSSTVHGFAFQTNYMSDDGDFTAETALPVETTMQSWLFLTGVDVAGSDASGAIVALGDSITDGAFSTPDTNHRWPDFLAERVSMSDRGAFAVLNQGIGGNRLLNDSLPEFPFFGPAALARFDREVLALPGVTHLIIFEGINDIGLSTMSGDPSQDVSAEEMIAGLRQLAERAHEHGIVAIGATITPYEGTENYFSADGEAKRQAVNDWIRSGGAFDGLIDFDAVVRDPDHPARLLSAYDGGDHLHMNDAGFQAMAESIDLGLFMNGEA
jgi:lysophospholipase L1-like esterase